jgi:hypothetical protein
LSTGGSIAVRWRSNASCAAISDSIGGLLAFHVQAGSTVAQWINSALRPRSLRAGCAVCGGDGGPIPQSPGQLCADRR